MSWYDFGEKEIDSYYAENKNGLLGKKSVIKLIVYPERFEIVAFPIYEGVIQKERETFYFDYLEIKDIYEGTVEGKVGIVVEYITKSILTAEENKKIIALDIPERQKWVELLKNTKKELEDKIKKEEDAKREKETKARLEIEKRENDAFKFYTDCCNFHISETTPCYELFNEKNKLAVIYIGKDRSLNFLKVDGYAKEESNGVIPFDKIHYYEKAGDIHYVSEIRGDYSSYGGSVTGGKFSKLATVGGGLLFGMMGMTAGALLSYKPAQSERIKTNFTIDSDAKKIDERSVMLNFYSDAKKQYIDIELPNDIYNFLQTHLPEKKYNIVLELEKKTAVLQATGKIESGELLHVSSNAGNSQLEDKQNADPMEEFKKKVEKLKLMKDAGLLSDEEFNAEKAKLLNMI